MKIRQCNNRWDKKQCSNYHYRIRVRELVWALERIIDFELLFWTWYEMGFKSCDLILKENLSMWLDGEVQRHLEHGSKVQE